jgi:hypothetical protein
MHNAGGRGSGGEETETAGPWHDKSVCEDVGQAMWGGAVDCGDGGHAERHGWRRAESEAARGGVGGVGRRIRGVVAGALEEREVWGEEVVPR